MPKILLSFSFLLLLKPLEATFDVIEYVQVIFHFFLVDSMVVYIRPSTEQWQSGIAFC